MSPSPPVTVRPSSLVPPQPALSSGSKDGAAHKDDGLFKAPPPPPKVIKSETLPTRLHQDIVTALKCRKEHKEVSAPARGPTRPHAAHKR